MSKHKKEEAVQTAQESVETPEAPETAQTDAEQTEQKASLETGQNQMPEEGYALQFGAFSTKDAAEKLAEALRLKGIETKIVEIDGVFKVISPMLDDKEAALKALQESKDKDVEDVFITSAG